MGIKCKDVEGSIYLLCRESSSFHLIPIKHSSHPHTVSTMSSAPWIPVGPPSQARAFCILMSKHSGADGWTKGAWQGGATNEQDAPWKRWQDGRIAGVNTATLHMQSVIGRRRKKRVTGKNITKNGKRPGLYLLFPNSHIHSEFSGVFVARLVKFREERKPETGTNFHEQFVFAMWKQNGHWTRPIRRMVMVASSWWPGSPLPRHTCCLICVFSLKK